MILRCKITAPNNAWDCAQAWSWKRIEWKNDSFSPSTSPFVWITTIQSWTALLESHYDLVVHPPMLTFDRIQHPLSINSLFIEQGRKKNIKFGWKIYNITTKSKNLYWTRVVSNDTTLWNLLIRQKKLNSFAKNHYYHNIPSSFAICNRNGFRMYVESLIKCKQNRYRTSCAQR